jgi:hypothetical protein
MEDNMLKQLQNVTSTQRSATDLNHRTINSSDQAVRAWGIWPNGDVIITWNAFQHPAARCGQHRHWEAYRQELSSSQNGMTESSAGPSPSIKTEFTRPGPAADFPQPDHVMSDDLLTTATTPTSPDHATSLIRNYVVNIHSKSPILDLEFLKHLESWLLKDSQLPNWPVHDQLPAGLQPPDMAILLLVLALGEVSTRTSPERESVSQSHYITMALPWLGVTAFSGGSPIQDLQALLLLSSYHMWILKPWEAWSYVETAAAKAETILMR